MPKRAAFPESTPYEAQLESLREGTFQKFASSWHQVAAANGTTAASVAVTHDLGEIPRSVDIILSRASDGATPFTATTDISYTKTGSTITISNAATDEGYYVQVRAF